MGFLPTAVDVLLIFTRRFGWLFYALLYWSLLITTLQLFFMLPNLLLAWIMATMDANMFTFDTVTVITPKIYQTFQQQRLQVWAYPQVDAYKICGIVCY